MTCDDVVAGGAVDGDGVELAVAGAADRRRARSIATCVTSVPVRSLTTMLSAPPRALNSMCSTSLRSIVTLAMSRVKRTRSPLAEMSMFSAMLAPLNSIVSMPAWPSTVSLPSPGFQTNSVVAGAQERGVVAVAADDEVVAVAADEQCRRRAAD